MRIVIDMQACQSPYSATRGVGRYTDNLVRALLKDTRGHEIYLALNGAFEGSVERLRTAFGGLISQNNIIVFYNRLKTEYATDGEISKPKKEIVRISEIVWEMFLNSIRPDVIFSPNMQEGFSDPAVTSVRRVASDSLYVTTLHDLTPYHFRDSLLVDETVRNWYEDKVWYAADSDVIVTDSDSSKADISTFLKIDQAKVKVVYCGYDDVAFDISNVASTKIEEVLKKYGLKDYIFYFGGADLCKNVPRLIEAYALLDEGVRHKYPLVLGGRSFQHDPYGNSHSGIRSQIENLELSGQIITPGFISDQDLAALLAATSCFVFPSTHEGFGLPALEAMACGAPVIGSNRSSVIEVIANEDALFDPYDVPAMASKINAVLTDPELRTSLRSAGLAQAKKFSWEKAACDLFDVLEEAVAHRLGKRQSYSGEPLLRTINAVRPHLAGLDSAELSALSRMLDESFPPSRKPCIYLDASTLVQIDDASGIQRVTRAIAAGLLNNPPSKYDVEIVYSSVDNDSFFSANRYKRDGLGISAPATDDYVAFKSGDILIFLDQAPRMAINHRGYIRYLREIGVRVYFYVYDLIPLHHPEWFPRGGVEEFAELMETVVTADGALCSSRAVSEDLKNYVMSCLEDDRRPFTIGYAHLGTDFEKSVPTRGMPEGSSIVLDQFRKRPSFLMVATVEPRKGHRQTLRAFEQLWAANVDANLVIVGRWGWMMDGFDVELRSHAEAGRRLFWLDGISDEYLLQVYRNCDCLIAASEAEGFGLPLIEAAQQGLPIIARDIPVFKEVAGDQAAFFADTAEPEVIAKAVRCWVELNELGDVTSSSKMNMLTWEQSISALLDIILADNWYLKIVPDRDERSTGSVSNNAIEDIFSTN